MQTLLDRTKPNKTLPDYNTCRTAKHPLFTRLHSVSQQSINQISMTPISLTKPGAVVRQPNRCSAKSTKQLRNINRPSGMLVLWGKGQVREMCLQMFLGSSNWNGWMDRQREVVPKETRHESERACASVGLVPKDQQTNSFVDPLFEHISTLYCTHKHCITRTKHSAPIWGDSSQLLTTFSWTKSKTADTDFLPNSALTNQSAVQPSYLHM